MIKLKNFWYSVSQRNLFWIFVLLGLALLATAPGFILTDFKFSWDGSVHAARLEQIYLALKHGSLPAPVSFIGLSHTLSAMESMYPWLSALVLVLPRFIFSNPEHAWGVGFFLINLFTVINAFFLSKNFTKNKFYQILGVAVYVFNGYHFTLMFVRLAVGELLAYTFFPLVLLGCYKIWQSNKKGVLILGLGMGMIANSHVLSLLFSAIIIAIIEIFRLCQNKVSWTEVQLYLLSAILAGVIGAYSLFNIVSIYLSNKVLPPFLALNPISPYNVISTMSNNRMYESYTTWNIGIVCSMMLMAFVLYFFFIRHSNRKKYTWPIWIFGSLVSIIATFGWFPWVLVESTPFHIIQFLGRILGFTALIFSVGTVLFFEQEKIKNKTSVITILLLVLIGSSSVYLYEHDYTNPGLDGPIHIAMNKENYHDIVENKSHFAQDYDPYILKNSKKVSTVYLDSGVKVKSTKNTYNNISYDIVAKKAVHAQLPIAKYNNVSYKIVLNGKKINPGSISTFKLPLQKGTNSLTISSQPRLVDIYLVVISMTAGLLSLVMLPIKIRVK